MMILADKMIALRRKAGWSQDELAQQLGVSRQAVSKWEGAQSMPDLERIVQLSRLFEVSIDYLLKDELEEPEAAPLAEGEDSPLRRVKMEEAAAYLDLSWQNAPWMALATALCTVSPVPLLLLCGLIAAARTSLTAQAAVGVGVILLLVVAALGVGIFMACGARTAPFRFLEEEAIETEYGVEGMVRARRQAFRSRYTRLNIAGVSLCILSAVPIFVVMAIDLPEAGLWYPAAVCILLVLAALGVFAFVCGGTCWGAMDRLLEEGDYTRGKKSRKKTVEAVAAAYWLAVTAGFLGYSLATDDWEHSWVVWPVAGVLFAAVMVLLELFCGAPRRREG